MTGEESDFDWEACWADPPEYDGWSYEWGERLASTFDDLFGEVGTPGSVASVGCGPATTLLELAERHPETEFRGYDVAERAIARARERGRERGVENASFAVDALPDLDADRTFEFVYSVATLHYVAESEAAVRSLWQRVEPGGHLAVNYPTPWHREEWAPDVLDDPVAVGFGDRDEAWVRDRFAHVLDGESVLTEERVGELVGGEPRDVRAYGVSLPDGIGERFRVTVVEK